MDATSWWRAITLCTSYFQLLRKHTNTLSTYSEADECSICKEPLDQRSTLTICKGKHIFHRDCLLTWLKIKTTCPLDRAAITLETAMPHITFDQLETLGTLKLCDGTFQGIALAVVLRGLLTEPLNPFLAWPLSNYIALCIEQSMRASSLSDAFGVADIEPDDYRTIWCRVFIATAIRGALYVRTGKPNLLMPVLRPLARESIAMLSHLFFKNITPGFDYQLASLLDKQHQKEYFTGLLVGMMLGRSLDSALQFIDTCLEKPLRNRFQFT